MSATKNNATIDLLVRTVSEHLAPVTMLLEEFIAATKGGLVVYTWRSKRDQELRNSLVNVLEEVLHTGRSGERAMAGAHSNCPLRVEWQVNNTLSIVFLAVFVSGERSPNKTLSLDRIVEEFVEHYNPNHHLSEGFLEFLNALQTSKSQRAEASENVIKKSVVQQHRNMESMSLNVQDKEDFLGQEEDFLGQEFDSQVVAFQSTVAPSKSTRENKSNLEKRAWLWNFDQIIIDKVSWNKTVSRDRLDPILKTLHELLVHKNVASLLANQVCADIHSALVHETISNKESLSEVIDTTVRRSLRQILSPGQCTDLLAQINTTKLKKVPFTIVFIGVNGVGKSTSLSKVAAWLRSNNFSVLVSACDTFRAGAVEQLRTHCCRLGVPLYERGYEKDPALIARDAIAQAKRQGIDVVLVDTAGRMQDNEPLMRSLSKLIDMNSPSLVLFVGEALVGNDGVDQLLKFNQSLADFSTRGKKQVIDGIVVSKFDMIDDKVGAVLSMVHASRAPIFFVGSGQTYHDLQVPNVEHLIDSLLSST